MRKHIFNAGPAVLPEEALKTAAASVLELDGSGQSILEVSHRGKEFVPILEEARQLIGELLNLSDDYSVLFLQGGASTQFCMVPYNMLPDGGTAAYIDTGSWANKAIKEAKLFGDVHVVGSSKDSNYNYIPKGWSVPDGTSYLHLTSNNTIYGTQLHEMPQTDVPVVIDMSSDIFSRQIDNSQFDLIYAGAQKNLGPAGTTLVAVKKSALGKVQRAIPTMLNYQTHIDKDSSFNTPPVFAIYMCMLTARWLKENGGVAAMEATNRRKADKLYAEIDRNPLFKGTAAVEDRSIMNVTFVSTAEGMDEHFLAAAADANIAGIKGYRTVGGFRASIYNALPESSVDLLIEVMKDFEQKFG